MTERDRNKVERIKKRINQADIGLMTSDQRETHCLLVLICGLEKQLSDIVEALKPIRFVVAHTESHVHDDVIVHTARLIGGNQYAYLEIGHLRRLVETLEE